MSWKRFRKSLKKLRDPELFAQVKAELAELSQMPDVKVAYFDEATFSLTAVVPYGWQDIGTRETIDLRHPANKNVPANPLVFKKASKGAGAIELTMAKLPNRRSL